MPDDPPRSPSGQQSDPRPAAGAPPWWGALGRPDLPLDGDRPPAPIRMAPPAHGGEGQPGASRAPRRWLAWALNAAVLGLAVLIVCIGVGVLSFRMFLTMGLVFGVPLIVAAGTAVVVARRSR